MNEDEPPRPADPSCSGRRRTLLVCERSGDWAHRLRRLLEMDESRRVDGANNGSHRQIELLQARSPGECLEGLRRSPRAFVALELEADNCDAVLDLLSAIDARFPVARTAVLTARSMRGYRFLLHELGAVCVVDSPRCLDQLVEVVRRHAPELPLAAGLAEETWELLPWQARSEGTP